ncbi:hypothetical protein E1B28_006386 [Marasmius oreades]|uniref:Uncharacterized protein n=1 Tax=Marasmius oreades TaxID=181124 RepID=A0A9P7S5A0_9AGAR|nr:uncharacterized protein E1B28_006386 [Marasmius oreades]KAG7095669.1 hypothetical protein E1B28_006386 [Marasmius oreades]
MSALSSFISHYTKVKRKPKLNNQSSFQNYPHIDSPSSPHPYASPVVDIRDTTSVQSRESSSVPRALPNPSLEEAREVTSAEPLPQTPDVEHSPSPEGEPPSPEQEHPPTPRLSTPPRMTLDLDISSGLMSDWIPSHLLDSEAYTGSTSNGVYRSPTELSPSGLGSDGRTSVVVDVNSVKEGMDDEDSDHDSDSPTSDHLVEQLQISEVSLNHRQSSRPARALPSLPFSPSVALKKNIPTPIKIPNPTFHGPKVQIIRTSGRRASYGQTPSSQPSGLEPPHSGEDGSASAVSGTTLARALIGNSYILSDERASKYRSGASILTRADSATLPRDDSSLLSSPVLASARERFISGMGHDIPPVPANADSVYIPPKNRRKLPAPLSVGRKRQSTGGLLSPDVIDGEVFGPVIHRSSSNGGLGAVARKDARSSILVPSPEGHPLIESVKYDRQISPISEVTSLATRSSSMSNSRDHLTPTSTDAFSASIYTPSLLVLEPDSPESEQIKPQTSQLEVSDSRPPQSPSSPLRSEDTFSPDARRQSDALSSTAPSSSSTGQFDNVLDYYEQPSANAEVEPQASVETRSPYPHPHGNHFRPPFSPISEESLSQLSPPSPFVQRDKPSKDRMSTLSGMFVLSRSPSSAGGSSSWSSSRADLINSGRLLPLEEITQAALPTTPSPSTPSTANSSRIPASSSSPSLQIPPRSLPSHVFNRQRSGSTPNPIQVVRDPKDRKQYNITISLRPGSSGSPPSTTESDEFSRQTFPETPSVFTPPWSPGSLISPGMPRYTLGDRESAVEQMFPQTPMSAFVFNMGITSMSSPAADGMPSLAQQLLTRAASSVQGVRSSRPGAEITRAKTVAAANPATMSAVKDSESNGVGVDKEETKTKTRDPQPSWITQHLSPSGSPSSSQYSHQQFEAQPASPPLAEPRQIPPTVPDPLPQLPPSPPDRSTSPTPSPQPQPSGFAGYPAEFNQSTSAASSLRQTVATTQTPTPDITPTGSTQNLIVISEQLAELVDVHPSDDRLYTYPQSSYAESRNSNHHDAFGDIPALHSPPPYYTLVFEAGSDGHTPSSGEPSTSQSGHSRTDSEYRSTTDSQKRPGNDNRISRRLRNRPGVPLGPRRPSDQYRASGSQTRERNASVSSFVSVGPSNGGGRRFSSTPLASPKNGPRFQTPPVRWRGYSMDAAKWTFTSSQLQAIVSRAIKQSSEASFIRLLQLPTVDQEIPNELRKLEMQRTDFKSRYKMLVRKRTELLGRLTSCLEGTTQEDNVVAVGLVSRLTEVSSQLDQLAEELHSADEQITQLKSLRDVHDGSALAMALRKLNTSFLKQLSISEGLRQQVESLEAERDDAWRHAEKVAADLDHLSGRFETPGDSPSASRSNRSSRVMALRKSSLRVSKAGLRSSSRRSSTSSHRLSTATLSGTKSAYSTEDIPPVPPIPRPRQRPVNIVTDLRTSTTGLYSDATPSSETRAMVQAHDELCDLLGIKMDPRPRRSRSVIENSQRISSSVSGSSRRTSSRPLSMPDDSGLTEVYNVMSADRNAMLATLEMLSDPA